MLTHLQVSSLTCKCVFYRPEHNAKEGPTELNFEGLEMQNQNIPTDRAQKLDGKNGTICLVIMFTPRDMGIKMSKMANFLCFLLMTGKNQLQFGLFSADDSKKSVTIWAKYLSISKRFYLGLSENVMNYWILSIH